MSFLPSRPPTQREWLERRLRAEQRREEYRRQRKEVEKQKKEQQKHEKKMRIHDNACKKIVKQIKKEHMMLMQEDENILNDRLNEYNSAINYDEILYYMVYAPKVHYLNVSLSNECEFCNKRFSSIAEMVNQLCTQCLHIYCACTHICKSGCDDDENHHIDNDYHIDNDNRTYNIVKHMSYHVEDPDNLILGFLARVKDGECRRLAGIPSPPRLLRRSMNTSGNFRCGYGTYNILEILALNHDFIASSFLIDFLEGALKFTGDDINRFFMTFFERHRIHLREHEREYTTHPKLKTIPEVKKIKEPPRKTYWSDDDSPPTSWAGAVRFTY
jgi:hypothetical protein